MSHDPPSVAPSDLRQYVTAAHLMLALMVISVFYLSLSYFEGRTFGIRSPVLVHELAPNLLITGLSAAASLVLYRLGRYGYRTFVWTALATFLVLPVLVWIKVGLFG